MPPWSLGTAPSQGDLNWEGGRWERGPAAPGQGVKCPPSSVVPPSGVMPSPPAAARDQIPSGYSQGQGGDAA